MFDRADFHPTPASIPPWNVTYRQQTVPGQPPHIHTLNPLQFLLRAAQIYADKLALAHPDVEHPVRYTYAVWAQRVQNLAYALKQAGIKPGDRVAVLAPNSPLIADAHHGILAARAVITPINTRLTKGEVEYIINHSGAKLILVDHEYAHLVEGFKNTISVIMSRDTGRSGDPYEEFLTSGRIYSNEQGWMGLDVEADENAAATLCYTSGTTGRPKGVVCTLRGSYLAAVANAYETGLRLDSVYLWVLPMFHASGWTFPWAITFAFATQVTMRTVSSSRIWNHFIHSGVTHYCGAPTVQIGVVNDEAAQKLEKPVVAIIAGSAPTAHLIGELETRNIIPVHVYGLTETYGPFTRNYRQPEWNDLEVDERAKFMARQGHAFATAQDARVVVPGSGDSIVDVPRDGKTVGEIVTRGNIVMKEYFRDPEATKKAFRGGFFCSGDLAVIYPDGSVYVQDRSKDIIISGGENASSLAIEQELSEHPSVQEVAVVARPHPKWGERPMAFVVLHHEAAKEWKGRSNGFEKVLKDFARTRLPGFACPEWVRVVEDLPRTSTGKILKTTLRGIAAKL